MSNSYSKFYMNLLPAVISSMIITITCVAAASLIFQGPLSPYLPIGISCALIGVIIVNFINSFYSVFPFAVSCMTPNASVIMAFFFGHILETPLSEQEIFYTIFFAFFLVNLIVALTIFLWGKFNLARLIRFMPYPVLSGFYAGVGGYLIRGAFNVVMNGKLSWGLITNLSQLMPILPMVLFAISGYLISIKTTIKHRYFYVVILFIGAFYLYLYLSHISVAQAATAGLLFDNFKIHFIYSHLTAFDLFSSIKYTAILHYWYYIPIIIVVNLLSLLAYAVNFEELSRADIDINKECTHVGAANIIASLFFGATTIFTTQSIVHKETGANHRLSIFYVAVLGVIILIFSTQIVSTIPKFIIAGFILINGIKLINKWLIQIRHKIIWEEWVIIISIFLLMMLHGFLQGVVIGVILACSLFIMNYSRLNIIRYGISGKHHVSNVVYPIKKIKLLELYGSQIYIIRLHGYIFFGSAEKLLDYIKEIIEKRKNIKYLIIDLELVQDFDSTATTTIKKIKRYLREHGIKLILTAVSKKVRDHLGLVMKSTQHQMPHVNFTQLASSSGIVFLFEDLNFGLEWCENQLLKKVEHLHEETDPGEFNFDDMMLEKQQLATFKQYLTIKSFKKGTVISKKGDIPDALYFVISGHVETVTSDDEVIVHQFGPGNIIGELAFFINRKKTKTIRCKEDTRFYLLSAAQFHQLQQQAPQISANFLKWLLKIVSERLEHANNEIAALEKL